MKIFLVVLLLLPLFAWANELSIIPLRHRSADDLIPIIRPLLDAGDVVSGMNDQLILRTSEANLQQIKRLLIDIDVAPRRLKITVLQNVDQETIARLTEVSGSVGIGRDARVSLPANGGHVGANVTLNQGQDYLAARVVSTRSLEENHKTQQVQVLEGNRALIRSGKTIPLPQRQIIYHPWGGTVVDSVQTQEVNSGFYVLPRINGQRVTLEISTQNDNVVPSKGPSNPANISIQQSQSTVSGRLGEWLVVGGLDEASHTDGTTISTRSNAQGHEQRDILIKVDELDREN